jgi:FlaA1/EpsC-like NDP-sugar epimerase
MIKSLITGGTGSLGKEIARQLTGDVTIFSRNEKDQILMKQNFPGFKYIIGDVRDYSEVLKATKDINYVFHLAAIKHIDVCEKQPQEAIKTNIVGTLNVISACLQNGCKMINMSSDKAINPTSVYGRTKALSESMVNQAGFVNIRSGNILWSSGSVLPIWLNQIKTKNCIELTSDLMTRFFVHPFEIAEFIISHKDDSGTFTIPMRSFNLYHIALSFALRYGDKATTIKITGLRPGERLHEYRDENTSSDMNVYTDIEYIFR